MTNGVRMAGFVRRRNYFRIESAGIYQMAGIWDIKRGRAFTQTSAETMSAPSPAGQVKTVNLKRDNPKIIHQ